MNLSIVIPTYNRPDALAKCLDSILSQIDKPHEVLIIDDSSSAETVAQAFSQKFSDKGVTLRYHKKESNIRRGLSESKNLSIGLASGEIICFLDDDIVLESEFIKVIQEQWQKADDKVIGVGGVISNNRKKSGSELSYNKFFFLNSDLAWDVNDAAFQVWDDFITEPVTGHYSHGGLTSYKKSALKDLRGFSVFSGGRTGLEDVDFCLKAKIAGYNFVVTPHARAGHFPESNREGGFTTGEKESANRRGIFQKRCSQSFSNFMRFRWALLGWVLRQFLAGHFAKGFGMIAGSFISTPSN